jgi:hypothetical protein
MQLSSMAPVVHHVSLPSAPVTHHVSASACASEGIRRNGNQGVSPPRPVEGMEFSPAPGVHHV